MYVLFADDLPAPAPPGFLEAYSNQIMMLVICAMVLAAVLVVVPQLLRARQRTHELQHEEHMRALEQGEVLPRLDERSQYAGRTAALVPMVAIISAGTVTCFLATNKSDNLFAVTLTVWAVAGVVSLAAITGGVALMGRIAQLHSGVPEEGEGEEEQVPEDLVEK
jgi:H+/gluconate symporter-like permease